MRWHLFLLLGGVVPLAGCHLAETAVHNAVNEPAMYLDEKHVTHQCRAEGRRVVRELRNRQAMSEDYEDGFVDGYADSLEHGGEPLPPAVPPTKYRRGRFLNANGHARIHDYYAGFQHGASCAAASGQREFLTIPVLLADPPPEPAPIVEQLPKELCGPQGELPKGQLPGVETTSPQGRSSLPPTAPPQRTPTDTTLLPPARRLAQPPVDLPQISVPLSVPEVTVDGPELEIPPLPDGVVPPRPEPRRVVPPKPEPR